MTATILFPRTNERTNELDDRGRDCHSHQLVLLQPQLADEWTTTCIYKQPSDINWYITSNMEKYVLSEDRIVLVNKVDGDYVITLKQKDSDEKCVVFTANR